MFRKILILTFIYFGFLVSLISAEFEIRTVAKNLDTPWEILWGPDNNIWMTERYGRISKVNPHTGELTTLTTISDVFENGERGLMGMALQNDFFDNPYLYVVYNTGNTDANTKIKIVRFTYNNNKLVEPLTIIDNIKGMWNHNGSRLWIDDDSKLWFTIGDAAVSSNAQDLSNLNGKLCRINLDGSIPDDNPFPNSAIWSYGHRNQQGMVFANGKIYTSEHGASIDDEINLIEKGRNYGWPQVEGFCNTDEEIEFCEKNNIAEPIKSLTPEVTYAIAGLDYYSSDKINEFQNSLLVVSLKSSRLTQLKLDDSFTKVLESNDFFINQFGRLRDLCISPDGRVFIATSNRDGRGSPTADDDRIIEIKKNESSVNDEFEQVDISIFPNPADNNILFNFKGNTAVSSINIIDLQGRTLKLIENITDSYNWNCTNDDNQKLQSGVYFVVIKTNSKNILKKILIK